MKGALLLALLFPARTAVAAVGAQTRAAEAPVRAVLPMEGGFSLQLSFRPETALPSDAPLVLAPLPPAVLGPSGAVAWEGRSAQVSVGHSEPDGYALDDRFAHISDLTDPLRSPFEAEVFRQAERGLRRRGWEGSELSVQNMGYAALRERVDWLADPAISEVVEGLRSGAAPDAALDRLFGRQLGRASSALRALGADRGLDAVAARADRLGEVLADPAVAPAVKRLLLHSPVFAAAVGAKPSGWHTGGMFPEDNAFLAGEVGRRALADVLPRLGPHVDAVSDGGPVLLFNRDAVLRLAIAHRREEGVEDLLRRSGTVDAFRAALSRFFRTDGRPAIGLLLGYPLRDVRWYADHRASSAEFARTLVEFSGGFVPDNFAWGSGDPRGLESVRSLAWYDAAVDLARERLMTTVFGLPPRGESAD